MCCTHSGDPQYNHQTQISITEAAYVLTFCFQASNPKCTAAALVGLLLRCFPITILWHRRKKNKSHFSGEYVPYAAHYSSWTNFVNWFNHIYIWVFELISFLLQVSYSCEYTTSLIREHNKTGIEQLIMWQYAYYNEQIILRSITFWWAFCFFTKYSPPLNHISKNYNFSFLFPELAMYKIRITWMQQIYISWRNRCCQTPTMSFVKSLGVDFVFTPSELGSWVLLRNTILTQIDEI